jgi:hypothetical protein
MVFHFFVNAGQMEGIGILSLRATPAKFPKLDLQMLNGVRQTRGHGTVYITYFKQA